MRLWAGLSHFTFNVKIPCTKEGCQEKILRKDKQIHEYNCPYRVLLCSYCGSYEVARELQVGAFFQYSSLLRVTTKFAKNIQLHASFAIKQSLKTKSWSTLEKNAQK